MILVGYEKIQELVDSFRPNTSISEPKYFGIYSFPSWVVWRVVELIVHFDLIANGQRQQSQNQLRVLKIQRYNVLCICVVIRN